MPTGLSLGPPRPPGPGEEYMHSERQPVKVVGGRGGRLRRVFARALLYVGDDLVNARQHIAVLLLDSMPASC